MEQATAKRLAAKSKEQQMLQILQKEFMQPPRVARAILEEIDTSWRGSSREVRPGQMRVMLVAIEARHGQPMAQTTQKEVLWTIDAGREDCELEARAGKAAVRRVRIQRLLNEAVEQGAVASQEDLARVLHVSVRTIKRDCAELSQQGVYLPTRGNLKGIGRGQSHKALIVKRWLRGETYDQIARATHHTVVSVQRYVQAFVRVIQLQQRGMTIEESALLLQIGWPLVADYRAILAQNDTPFVRERLTDQLARLRQRTRHEKKRVA